MVSEPPRRCAFPGPFDYHRDPERSPDGREEASEQREEAGSEVCVEDAGEEIGRNEVGLDEV